MGYLIIIGAGGMGREAMMVAENNGEEILGFYDDDESKIGYMGKYPVLNFDMALCRSDKEDAEIDKVSFHIAIADPMVKEYMALRIKNREQFLTLIGGDVDVRYSLIGLGCMIGNGCVLTHNIVIGDHVTINPQCGIGHDTKIGDFSTLMWRVNLSGNVTVERRVVIGTGAVVLPGITIGKDAVIGAGAVVTKDVPAGVTAKGIPARWE